MRRNAAGQVVTFYLRTTSATPTAIVTGATVYVSKDGGTPAAGAGTLTYIGTQAASYNADRGLWKYVPTAAETNASTVSFMFGSSNTTTAQVEKMFETTAGPILYQALLSASGGAVTNQTTIVLPSATPLPSADDDAYNGCAIVFYDGSTAGQVAVGVIADYVGSTRTITLREAPPFTITTSDFLTIISDNALKPTVPNRNALIDANGRVDVAAIAGTAQTALDLGGIIADSVPSDGTRPTIQQALYIITQFLLERSVSGTTLTVKKVDGTTSLLTCTLGDATSPTSITRAT